MVFLYPALASSIVRAKQAQLGPLDGRGFETPRVQNTLLPNPSEGSAPSLRAAASESASCRRLGVTQAVASVPRAARPWPCATPYLTLMRVTKAQLALTLKVLSSRCNAREDSVKCTAESAI